VIGLLRKRPSSTTRPISRAIGPRMPRLTKEDVDRQLKRNSRAFLGLKKRDRRLVPGKEYKFGRRTYRLDPDGKNVTEVRI